MAAIKKVKKAQYGKKLDSTGKRFPKANVPASARTPTAPPPSKPSTSGIFKSKIGSKVKKAQTGVRKSPQREAYDRFQSQLDERKAFIGPLTENGFIKGQQENWFQEVKKEEDEKMEKIKDPERRREFEKNRQLSAREYYGDGRYKRGGKVKKIMKRGGKVTRAQTGKKLDPSKLERLRVKPVTDSFKLQDIKKSVNQTTDDYLKSKDKAKPKAKMGMKVGSKMSKATHGTKISKSTKKK